MLCRQNRFSLIIITRCFVFCFWFKWNHQLFRFSGSWFDNNFWWFLCISFLCFCNNSFYSFSFGSFCFASSIDVAMYPRRSLFSTKAFHISVMAKTIPALIRHTTTASDGLFIPTFRMISLKRVTFKKISNLLSKRNSSPL